MHDHNAPDRMITIKRNQRSRSNGTRTFGNALAPAQLGNAGLTAQPVQHDADLVLGGIVLPGRPADVFDQPRLRRRRVRRFLVHLDSSRNPITWLRRDRARRLRMI
jgi:hypothetical protein